MRSGWSRLLVHARNGSILFPANYTSTCLLRQVTAVLQVPRRRHCQERGEQMHVHVRKAGAASSASASAPPFFSDFFYPDIRFCFTATQGWVTAANESLAVRISASDGFDLTSCVAPKPAPPKRDARPQSAAPAPVLKNPYRGLVKDEKITWVSDCGCSPLLPAAPASHTCCRPSASRPFPLKTLALLPRFSSGCTAPAFLQ